MVRLLQFSVAAVALVTGIAAIAQPSERRNTLQPPAAPADGATKYDASFFVRYAPRTALDIVQRIPGFTLDLGSSSASNGVDVRGFAGTAGNVVLNGQRPSTKSETLDVLLNRIPASRVVRVEVGPGDLFGSDYSDKSQVANLILKEGGGGIAGNVSVSAERHYTGVITPTGSGSVSVSRGPSAFTIAGDTARVDQTEEGFDRVIDAETGDLLEFRRKMNEIRDYSPAISASWSLDKGATDSANLNLRYHFDHFTLQQTNHVTTTGAPQHDDTLIEDYPTKTFEVGGDVTRPLAGGAVKLVGLASRQRRRTLDESDVGNLGHSEVVGGFQQLSLSQRNETLGRLTWSKQRFLGLNFEAGGEVAWNTLDHNLQLFELEEGGGKTRIDLPLDNARVIEVRGESWVNGSRALSKSLRVDIGLNYEMSHLRVSGDATADRELKFLKPSITLDWQPRGGWHGEISIRRTVAQLDFFDFISAADLSSNEINGGNANLQPQRSWEGRVSLEHPLFNVGKARLELGYNLISRLQDRILTTDGFDAPGNIGTGRQMYADLTIDAPLDRLWKGLRVKFHGNVQRTRVRDPISGELRDFSGSFPRWEWDANVRRDIGQFAFGFDMTNLGRTTLFRTDVFDSRFFPSTPYSNAFIEYRPRTDQTFSLNLSDILNSGAFRDLLEFVPNRTVGVPSELDHRFRNSHVRVGITFKQSFGQSSSAGATKS
jgi:outer membrane beta-barrel protein/TonB-dependent receptor-like protein